MTNVHEQRLPVTLITGFLGSGKSSLINVILRTSLGKDTAVLINEIGDISIDHLIVNTIQDNIVVLENGCICCSIRGDIKTAILTLMEQKNASNTPLFSRLIIETTGLALPAPIIATLINDPLLRHHLTLTSALTVVDAQHAWQQQKHPEWLAQISIADQLIISKIDLIQADTLNDLKIMLASLNPFATIYEHHLNHERGIQALITPTSEPNWIFRLGKKAHSLQPSSSTLAVQHRRDKSPTIYTYTFSIDYALNWEIVTLWLSLIIHKYGNHLLRFKAILNLEDSTTPTVLHAIHHLMYPVTHLTSWFDSAPLSQFVFIMDQPGLDRLEDSLHEFSRTLIDS